jgi:S-disulfanyl-L-cysteine oxidoreductase SoxD
VRLVATFIAIAAAWLKLAAQSAETPAPSVWAGVYTAAQVARGDVAYGQECASCHGTALEGGDMTPALVGGGFTSNWNDLSVGDLFERIRVTMPLDRPGKLTRQQNADVIAFLLNANGWPEGKADLVPELGALKQIRIQSTKPAAQP